MSIYDEWLIFSKNSNQLLYRRKFYDKQNINFPYQPFGKIKTLCTFVRLQVGVLIYPI